MVEQLNPSQIKAIEHFYGPMMVISGPGSGKTSVIAHRTHYLIQKHNVPPNQILVITFTKQNAIEMKERFVLLCRERYNLVDNKYIDTSNEVTFSTFHSLFFKILRTVYYYSTENIISDDEKKFIISKIIHEQQVQTDIDDDFVNKVVDEISFVKNNLATAKNLDVKCCSKVDFIKIISAYESVKHENKKIDFDDMLTLCYKLFKKNANVLSYWQQQFKFILIDEFQDINMAQFECIKMLAALENNIFVVGDDDQSIYKFRGSRPDFLLNFEKQFPGSGRIYLNTNYRSTDNIVFIANKCIKNNTLRIEKNILGTGIKGDVPILLKTDDINKEASAIADKILNYHQKNNISYNEMAVLYRTNMQARAFIDIFMDLRLPFIVKDEVPNLYDHWICNDICAYLQLSLDPGNDELFVRIMNKPSRYLSKSILEFVNPKKYSGGFLSYYKKVNQLKKWQVDKLNELNFYLSAIKNRTPSQAIKYIRGAVNYDEYIESYAKFKKINPRGLYEYIDELGESAKQFDDISAYLQNIDILRQQIKKINIKHNDNAHNSITLSTIHNVKGCEFEIVFIVSTVEGVLPHEKSEADNDIEEERRLFYVGITRAKRQLYISTVNNRYEKKTEMSRFIKEIL